MFLRLLFLFTVVPAVELYLLIMIGQVIGPAETVLIILLTGVVGAALAKREGFRVIRRIQAETQKGIPPGDQLVEGLLVLIGGVLLITPGVLTDLTGFALIAPPTRRRIVGRVKAWLAARVEVHGMTVGPARPGPAARNVINGFDHPVE